MAIPFLERVIAAISPGTALARARQSVTLGLLRKYEGASTSYRNKHWPAASTDATTEIAESLETLRNRSRQLTRDYSYASRGVRLWADQTVGAGIIPRPSFSAKRIDELVTREWAEFVKTCFADGEEGFYGIQNLVMRCMVESGEAMIVYVPQKDGTFKLRVLEPDYLDLTNETLPSDGTSGWIDKGIEYDNAGNIVAYWIFDSHPGGSPTRYTGIYSKRVLKEYVLRVFRRDRPGQQHGVPWMAPVATRLRNLDEATDASGVALKMSACLTGVVTGMESGPLVPSEQDSTGARIESLRPGAMAYLSAGQDIKFSSPPAFGQNVEFMNSLKKEIAVGLGIPYELLAEDYSKSSFSASRMAMLPFRKEVDCVRNLVLIPMLCEPVWEWFMRSLELRGIVRPGVSANSVVWTAPKWESIDPKAEAEAHNICVRNGFEPWQDVVSQYGGDPDLRVEEITKFNESVDAGKIFLDCDPRKVSKSGTKEIDVAKESPEESAK